MAVILLIVALAAFVLGLGNFILGTTVIALGFFFIFVVALSGAGIIDAIQNKR